MPRNKIDVQQIDFSEVVSQNVSVSGSLTVDGSTKVNSNSLVNQKAIQLDGTSPFDEVTISDATTATSFSSGGGTDKAFTISMWVNLEEIDYDGTNGKHAGALYTKRSTSPNNGEIYIGVGSGRLTFILYADPDQNGVGSFSTSNRLVVAQSSGNFQFFHAENTWFHLCITYDGTKALTGIRIYKNSHPVGSGDIFEGGGSSTTNTDLNVPNLIYFGTMAATNYSGTPQTSIPTTLGGIDVSDSSANALAGKLADVCRFNRALTHTEVQELYNDGNVKNMEEHSAYSDLAHWWKMGDHIDTTGEDGIKDYVGGYHGTLGGDASIVSETTLGSDVSSTIHFNTSGSVGIGTTNPSAELDVKGNSRFLGDLEVDGKLAVGTETPAAVLDVVGNSKLDGDVVITGSLTQQGNQIKITSAGSTSLFLEADTDNVTETDTAYIKLSQDGGVVNSHIGFAPADGKNPENSNYTDAKSNALLISNNYPNTHLQLGTTTTVAITIDGSQNVGIGTNAPSHLLDVDGNANISGSLSFEDYMILSVTADNTDIQTGTGQMTFRAPFAMELYQIPRASLSTASTSGAVTVDINNGGSTIFSTNLTIDANESTSTTAATAAVLSQTSIADDAQITIDVDGAGTGARGLKITLYYRRIV